MARIVVLGGDGFCGWPTALKLSAEGHQVAIIDNLSRRRIDAELGVESLTPIADMPERIAAWKRVSGKTLAFANIDIAHDYEGLRDYLADFAPQTIVHFAEQRAAPYSMKSSWHKRYTVDNNVNATHNLLAAVVESGLDVHVDDQGISIQGNG